MTEGEREKERVLYSCPAEAPIGWQSSLKFGECASLALALFLCEDINLRQFLLALAWKAAPRWGTWASTEKVIKEPVNLPATGGASSGTARQRPLIDSLSALASSYPNLLAPVSGDVLHSFSFLVHSCLAGARARAPAFPCPCPVRSIGSILAK